MKELERGGIRGKLSGERKPRPYKDGGGGAGKDWWPK